MSDEITKASGTEVSITKTVVRTIKLAALVSRRAAYQAQLDLLAKQMADLDEVIKEAQALGVVTVAPVPSEIVPINPETK